VSGFPRADSRHERRVKLSTVAELQVLLEGVPLPVGRDELVRYAEREGAGPRTIGLLRGLPERRYQHIDEVAETLAPVQPRAGESNCADRRARSPVGSVR
jgi:Protein of unknown function (DUF2795)